MDLSQQSKIIVGYESDDDSGLTDITFSAPGDVSLGVITMETVKLLAFFNRLSDVFRERQRASGESVAPLRSANLLARPTASSAEITFP